MSHLAAIMALLPDDIRAYDTDVYNEVDDSGKKLPLAYPYVVFYAGDLASTERSINGVLTDIDEEIQASVVGVTVEQVRAVAPRVHAALHKAKPVVEGFATSLRYVRSERMYVDPDVTLAETGHPALLPQQYRYRATAV